MFPRDKIYVKPTKKEQVIKTGHTEHEGYLIVTKVLNELGIQRFSNFISEDGFMFDTDEITLEDLNNISKRFNTMDIDVHVASCWHKGLNYFTVSVKVCDET